MVLFVIGSNATSREASESDHRRPHEDTKIRPCRQDDGLLALGVLYVCFLKRIGHYFPLHFESWSLVKQKPAVSALVVREAESRLHRR